MNKAQAIHAFWSSFKWPAYDQATTPDDAPFPRITYNVQTDDFDKPVFLSASLWDRSTSWESVSLKADEIAQAIKSAYPSTKAIDGGRMYVTKGSPFSTRMSDPDSTLRRIVLNVNFEFMTNY